MVRLLALGRLALGAGLAIAPGRGIAAWTGDENPSVGARLAARGLGGRDVAIALGTLSALEQGGGPARRWLATGVIADASDGLSALMQWRSLPRFRRLVTLLTASGAVLLGLKLAAAFDED